MAAVTPRVFVDTTVLVEGLIDFGTSSKAAGAILDAVASGKLTEPLTAWHCCLEFFSVATRLPGEFRLRPDEARRLVTEEVLPRFKICALSASIVAILPSRMLIVFL